MDLLSEATFSLTPKRVGVHFLVNLKMQIGTLLAFKFGFVGLEYSTCRFDNFLKYCCINLIKKVRNLFPIYMRSHLVAKQFFLSLNIEFNS